MLAAALLATLATAACPANLATEVRAQPPAAAQQLLTVHAPTTRSTRGSLRIWRRDDGCWRLAGGPYPTRLGVNGVRADRHEGDGTTPVGTFRIGRTMYGVSPNPGVRYRYVRLRCGDWWVEDPRSRFYNTFRRTPCGSTPPFRTTTPDMYSDPRAYVHLAVIEFNMRPVVPGRGSGIFLHAMKDGPTAGCVSLSLPHLRTVLRWLRPGASPHIAIGTRAQLRG
jgi:L,D-peptidoglycan transpeptidase YkuD (ErfK/YbiS/YcfS/YnhG family)